MSLFDRYYEIVRCRTCPDKSNMFRRVNTSDCPAYDRRMCEAMEEALKGNANPCDEEPSPTSSVGVGHDDQPPGGPGTQRRTQGTLFG